MVPGVKARFWQASANIYPPSQTKRVLGLNVGVRKARSISRYQHNFGMTASVTGRLHAKAT